MVAGKKSSRWTGKYKRGAHEGIHRLKTTWPGFLQLIEAEYVRKHADTRGESMLGLMKSVECDHCNGFRLKQEILQYKIKDLHIGKVAAMTAEDALIWFSDYFHGAFGSELEKRVAAAFHSTITDRLDALVKAGLGYISTDRVVGTLSGGEFQRLQLAGLVKVPLTGAAYILDEPSFGLHPQDTRRISDLITSLNQHGNTIILVDHSPMLLGKSEFLIELGPGGGSWGGEVLFAGKTEVRTHPGLHDCGSHSLTYNGGMHASFRDTTPVKQKDGVGLRITGARANNLQDIDLEITTDIMTVITGVSGSGKTSLLDTVIFESFSTGRPCCCDDITGFENFSNLIYIEQPIPGKGHTATTGNMLGLSDIISRIFAESGAGKARLYKYSHFTRGSRDSRCTACDGTGVNLVSMDFFSDVASSCERCGGKGFRDEVLEVLVDGKNIYDILQIPFNELSGFLDPHLPCKSKHKVQAILALIEKTGLLHLSCGRSLKTLSTGELQRLKLVSGLSANTGSNMLFLLDEPTGGLHEKDIEKLLKLFNELIHAGNTIVCVTHEPIFIDSASGIIELGPGGGTRGGRVVAQK